MWYPATVTVPVASEPITPEMARRQCRVDGVEHDADLARLAKAVRGHVEGYTATRVGEQTVQVACDRFGDFALLSEAPARTLVRIDYVDPTGTSQQLPDDVCELLPDGLEPSIRLLAGHSWPAIAASSRIVVTLDVGLADVPPAVEQAMLLLLGHWFEHRESINVGNIVNVMPQAFDDLLMNHRRWL